jgi:hypothetical protein
MPGATYFNLPSPSSSQGRPPRKQSPPTLMRVPEEVSVPIQDLDGDERDDGDDESESELLEEELEEQGLYQGEGSILTQI